MTVDEMRKARRKKLDRISRKRRALEQARGISTSNVPAAQIRVHLQRLHNLGWSWEAIAWMHGNTTDAALAMIANSQQRTCDRKHATIMQIPFSLAVPDAMPDNLFVPALGPSRRIQGLLAMGWTHAHLADEIGRSTGAYARASYRQTLAIDAKITAVVYEKLSAINGPSNKSRVRARNLGYGVPLSWTDIDNPNERPKGLPQISAGPRQTFDPVVVQRILDGDWKCPSTAAEKRAVVAAWIELGKPLAALEKHTGWNVNRYKGEAA